MPGVFFRFFPVKSRRIGGKEQVDRQITREQQEGEEAGYDKRTISPNDKKSGWEKKNTGRQTADAQPVDKGISI